MTNFTIQNLNINNVKSSLNNVRDLKTNNLLNDVYNKTLSSNYSNILPSGLVEKLNLSQINNIKKRIDTLLINIDDFIKKVETFDETDMEPNQDIDTIEPKNNDPTMEDAILTLLDFLDILLNNGKISQDTYLLIKNLLNLLIEALKTMTERFNVIGTQNVEAYFYTGDVSCITSRNNLRARLEEFGFRKKLRKILSDENLTFIEYANLLLQKNYIVLESLIVKKDK